MVFDWLDRQIVSHEELRAELRRRETEPWVRRFRRWPASGWLSGATYDIEIRPPGGWEWLPEWGYWTTNTLVDGCDLQVEIINTQIEGMAGYFILGTIDTGVHHVHLRRGTGWGQWVTDSATGRLAPFPVDILDHDNYLNLSINAAGDRYHWFGMYYVERQVT